MLSLIRHGQHAAPKPDREHTSREMPATPPVPREFWPVFEWLEARARGVAMDPQHDAAMRALHAELEAWQQEQRQA